MRVEDVKDHESLKAYLNGQPVEVARAVAVRAALCVLPLSGGWKRAHDHEAVQRRDSIFATFRATQISWATAVGPAHDIRLATDAAIATDGARARDLVQAAVTDAAANAATAITTAATAARAHAAVAVAAAAAATAATRADFWEVLRSWLGAVDGLDDPFDMLQQAVWPEGHSPLAAHWNALKVELLDEDPNWRFWTDWYDRRIVGVKETDFDIYLKVAGIAEKDWAQGPVHVNAMIAGWLDQAEERALPPAPSPEDLPPAERNRLVDQVEFLIKCGAYTEITASSLSDQLQLAITEYCKAAKLNELPEGLQVIQHIATTLSRVARGVASDSEPTKKKSELEEEVLRLNGEIEVLRKKLAAAEYRDNWDKFVEAAYVSAGKLAGPAILTGSFVFVSRFIDPGTMNAVALEARAIFEQYRPAMK